MARQGSHWLWTGPPGRTAAPFPRCPCGELGWAASTMGERWCGHWHSWQKGRFWLQSGDCVSTSLGTGSQSLLTHVAMAGRGGRQLSCCWHVSTAEMSPLWG